MGWVHSHGWLTTLGAILISGGFLGWIIGILSASLIVEAVGQTVYGIGCATWGFHATQKPVAAQGGMSRQGPVWLIIAGIGFAAMTIIDFFARSVQD